MAPRNSNESSSSRRIMSKGAWTAEEDSKLSQYIEIHGAKKWKTLALKSGLNRCGKSCRLRWLNYLRPNIKRGNITDAEEDLIIRLHKLLGNRWSLIAGRIPGRTDNEIKNYWNSHLSKRIDQKEKSPQSSLSLVQEETMQHNKTCEDNEEGQEGNEVISNSEINFDVNEFFDFSSEGCHGLDWVNKFLQLEGDPSLTDK